VDAALALARGAGTTGRDLCAHLGNERGELLDELGRGTEALELFEEFRAWAAAEGGASTLAGALANLAVNAVEAGAPGQARGLLHAALEAAEAGGSPPLRGDVLAIAGLVELRLGRPVAAVAALRESVQLMCQAGQLLSVPDAVSLLGAAFLAAGEPGASARLLAAGQAWRVARGQAVVGRLPREVVAEAERQLPSLLRPDELAAQRVAGTLAPYGSLPALAGLWRVVAPVPEPSAAATAVAEGVPGGVPAAVAMAAPATADLRETVVALDVDVDSPVAVSPDGRTDVP
jgi:hypothetical protein